MSEKMDSPAASGKANGAEMKAVNFRVGQYPTRPFVATPFEHVSVAAFRVAHWVARPNVDPGRAAILAGLIFGESRS